METVARFAGISVADVVGDDAVVTSGIEQLSFAKELVGKFRTEELGAASGGAVKNQNGVANGSVFVPLRRAKGAVMHPQFRQGLAGVEVEIAEDVIGFNRRGIVRRSQ